jgi:hypothetical protein
MFGHVECGGNPGIGNVEVEGPQTVIAISAGRTAAVPRTCSGGFVVKWNNGHRRTAVLLNMWRREMKRRRGAVAHTYALTEIEHN